MFSAKEKKISRLNWKTCHVLYIMHWLITKVIFILSSISSGLEFSSVNYTSINETFRLNVFKKTIFLIIDQIIYWE